MTDHPVQDPPRELQAGSVAPINSQAAAADEGVWTRRLVLYLRVMAGVAMIKGLYHWAQVTGFIGGEADAFMNQPVAWRSARAYGRPSAWTLSVVPSRCSLIAASDATVPLPSGRRRSSYRR